MPSYRFDAQSSFQDCFQEQLLKYASSPVVYEIVRRKLREIKADPTQGEYHADVAGWHWYIARTGPVETSGVTVAALLIVYRLLNSRVIQPLYLCPAADAFGATGEPTREALERLIDRAIEQAQRTKAH